jgi:hypothetical protein
VPFVIRPSKLLLALALLPLGFVGSLTACDRSKTREPAPPPAAPAPSAAEAFDAGSLAVPRPSPDRVVAIGDLHGDLEATRRVLKLAGAIDDKDAWVGGKLVLVQTGDQIDRGDDDRTIIDLFEALEPQAKAAGGEVVAMVGNHEIMNASFDFRYVTDGAFVAFEDVTGVVPRVPGLETSQRGRAAAFAPGGAYAKKVADRPVVARVGDSIFVHGGVLPKHVRYGLDRINDEARAWLEGRERQLPPRLASDDAPIWSRMYSTAPGKEECKTLEEVLSQLGAKRMVMGHTVQKPGISAACGDRAWRIDVGLAKFYGGPVQALEIRGDSVKVLAEQG